MKWKQDTKDNIKLLSQHLCSGKSDDSSLSSDSEPAVPPTPTHSVLGQIVLIYSSLDCTFIQ